MRGDSRSCSGIFVLFGLGGERGQAGRGCLGLFFFLLVCFTDSTERNAKNGVKESRGVLLSLATAPPAYSNVHLDTTIRYMNTLRA